MKIIGKIFNQQKFKKLPPPIGEIKDIMHDVSRSFVFMRDAPIHKILFELPCCIRLRPFVTGVVLCLCLMIF